MTNTQEVEDWWISFIETRRVESSAPFHTVQDYSSPCQVEVFWIEDPLEGQLIFVTRDSEREDKEVIVNGPYSGENFIEKVAEVSKEDRWQKEVPPQDFKSPPGQTPRREDVLASLTSSLVDRLEESIFTDFSTPGMRFLEMGRLWPQSSFRILTGNVVDNVPSDDMDLGEDEEEQDEDETESGEADESESKNEEDENSSEQEQVTETQPAGGGFIYQPVWVDEAPTRTFEEKVWDSGDFDFDVVFEAELCGLDFQVRRDGLLYLVSDDGEEIQQILNTFFGVGILHRSRRWRTLLGREIISAKYAEGEISSASYESSTPSGRNQLASPADQPPDHKRSIVTTEAIKRFIEITDVVYPIHNVRNRIILHLQAHTHLLDDELDASFVLNWTVVEQLIDDLLKRNIKKEYGLDWEDKALEYAAAADIIEHSEYEMLDDFRDKRNEIIHHMGSASAEEAEKLDILLSKLLVRDINHYLEQNDVQEINYQPYPIKYSNRIDNDLRWELSNI
jgi:hypothetical protein